ncbi:MAG TPA: glycosyltransferase [Lacisediminihabitans sp.]|uniref:glycosyltransferase n=1 Tax=Lacisediminihabitans sp. TaxID=2787631 RepID=UPI002ED9F954
MTTIVVCSLESWDGVWRRNQHLVHRLLNADPRLRVLFIEPSPDPIHEVLSRRRPRRGSGARSIDGYDGRLVALEATKWLPRAIGRLSDVLLRRQATQTLDALGWRPDLLWVNDPKWRGLAGAEGWPTLYDITDDWVRASRGSRQRATIIEDDAALLDLSEVVVVCSPDLEKVKGAVRPVVLIPNAVDLDAYRAPVLPSPDDLPAGPVALYAGTLHEDRLDVPLVLETADAVAEKDGRVVLIGPNALGPGNAEALRAHPSVRLLGSRRFDTVPSYLVRADVLIVPHAVTDFTESLDPIKLYEYLASGRPIVSTPVAGFRQATAQAELWIAAPDEFAHTVLDVASPRRSSVLREGIPDWTDRAAAFRAEIDRAIDDPPRHRVSR